MRFLTIACFLLVSIISVQGQNEDQLKRYFEGRRVVARMDMPATKDGVNIYPNRDNPIDDAERSARLDQHGAAVRAGDEVVITKIKVKGKHIEIQLGGGGYGTFWHESASVSAEPVYKSRREKRLERELRNENDERRRRRLRSELRSLRNEREEQEDINREEAGRLSEEKAVVIAERALGAGSRFNLRYEEKLTAADLSVESVRDVLSRFLEIQ